MDRFSTNVRIKKTSSRNIEYWISMPGGVAGLTIWSSTWREVLKKLKKYYCRKSRYAESLMSLSMSVAHEVRYLHVHKNSHTNLISCVAFLPFIVLLLKNSSLCFTLDFTYMKKDLKSSTGSVCHLLSSLEIYLVFRLIKTRPNWKVYYFRLTFNTVIFY